MLDSIIWTFIIPSICTFSFMTNILNIIVSKKMIPINKFYNLIYIKSIVNSVYLFSLIFVFMTRCDRFCPTLKNSYISKLYKLYILYYFTSSLALLDLIIELAISLKRYFYLNNRNCFTYHNLCCKKFKLQILIMYSFLQFLPVTTFYKIVEIKTNSTNNVEQETRFELELLKEYKTIAALDEICWFTIRMLLLISLIISINAIMCTKFRMKTNKLLRLIELKKNTTKIIVISNHNLFHKLKFFSLTYSFLDYYDSRQLTMGFDLIKTRKNLTNMIICVNLNYIIGTLFLSISTAVMFFTGGRSNASYSLLISIGNSMVFLSYGLNLFIYCSFNKLFRCILFNLLKTIFQNFFPLIQK